MKGLPTIGFKSISIRESHMFGKMSYQPFAKSKTVTEFPLQLIHIDLCGPVPILSLFRARYFISLIDNTIRFIVFYFLKQKSEAFVTFNIYKQLQKIKIQEPLKRLEVIMVESMYHKNGKIFSTKMEFIRKQYPTLQNIMASLKERTQCC